MTITYNKLLDIMNDADIEQIFLMPEPSSDQALYIIREWNRVYGNNTIVSVDDLCIAKGMAKLVVRCKQIYPEYFI